MEQEIGVGGWIGGINTGTWIGGRTSINIAYGVRNGAVLSVQRYAWPKNTRDLELFRTLQWTHEINKVISQSPLHKSTTQLAKEDGMYTPSQNRAGVDTSGHYSTEP